MKSNAHFDTTLEGMMINEQFGKAYGMLMAKLSFAPGHDPDYPGNFIVGFADLAYEVGDLNIKIVRKENVERVRELRN